MSTATDPAVQGCGHPAQAARTADAPSPVPLGHQAPAAAAPSGAVDFDLVLAGGGLANGLIAWRLLAQRPTLRILLIEGGATLGGNHTWSFHDGDVDAAQRDWLRPFVVHHWSQHAVLFRSRTRSVRSGYNSVTSERFHALLTQRLADAAPAGSAVRLGTRLTDVAPTWVRTADGEVIRAAAVIDGRGFRPSTCLRLRYQKFLGVELQLGAPHALEGPIIMDARVPQHDGYRFVYVLPLAADRLLIEDTYYSDSPELAIDTLRERVLAYAGAQRWPVSHTLREEQGVLPIALDGDIAAFWREARGQPSSGLAAGLFHPTTGYSLPQATRLADLLCRLDDLSAPRLAAAIEAHACATWRSQSFFRMLNRMLYLAGRPEARERVMAHFYRLPDRLVGRFYGERLSIVDKLRIVSGRPPVPMGAALRAIVAPLWQGRPT